MTAILIQGTTEEDFLRKIAELLRPTQTPHGVPVEINGMTVDRRFLMRNFKWTRYQIEQLERDGRLLPVVTGDNKSRDYLLTDCIAIRQREISEVYNSSKK